MVAVLDDSESVLPPPLAGWVDEIDPDDPDDDDEDDDEKPAPPSRPASDTLPYAWSNNIWALWNPEGTSQGELPPVAIAALADSIAAAGQSPSCVIADLRAEIADAVASGSIKPAQLEREEAAIARLEKELCGGAVPAGKCCKCRVAPRAAKMVSCGHMTLCTACERSVCQHVNGHAGRSKHLARLMCPICRGHELEDDASADSLFKIVDRDGNGVIESGELLLHLLVAGQEADSISELFQSLDTDADGVISRDEWSAGFEQYKSLASTPRATPMATPMATPRGEPEAAPAEDA